LISHQEHEAWDALLACQGQPRLAPSGQVLGIMSTALRLGAARSCDLAVLSELLPAAEAGADRCVVYGQEVGVMDFDQRNHVSSRIHCGHCAHRRSFRV
jgi:hypothetical protein